MPLKPEYQSLQPPATEPTRSKYRHWIWRLSYLFIFIGVCAAFVWLNNNFRLQAQARSEFNNDLNRSLSAAIDYLDSHRLELTQYDPNCALIYMIRDMAILTGDERLHGLVEGYVLKFPQYFWQHMIFWQHPNSKKTELAELPKTELARLTLDQRWFYYVIGGTHKVLPQEEIAVLMSPNIHVARKLTHQLFALNLYQGNRKDDGELKALRMQLCERIADEAAFDCRVSDLYYQRLAFLLMAEREDLINPRWVELVMKFQQTDGGWGYPYCPLWVETVLGEQASDDHAAVQAAWVLCQIKHRYPHWITAHYGE